LAMGKILYENTMQIQTFHEIGFGYPKKMLQLFVKRVGSLAR